MTTLFSDTTPAAEQVLVELLRQAPVWRKMEMLAQLNAAAHGIALAGLRRRYPQAGEAEMRRRLADLLLGPELAAKVYGPLERALQEAT
jgi:hypothetical protein